jgi:small subunit ribosomal protein S14
MVILRSIRWPRKEVKKRKLYKKFEIKKLVLKSLLNNFYYKYKFKLYFTMLFSKFPINSSISRYRTYCMLQLQGKSIFRFFKLSRHMVRYCVSNGLLIGFRKSSF